MNARSRRTLVFAALVFGLCLAVRLLFVTADPPTKLPVGLGSLDLFAEPPAKAHEARNWALFGAWKISPVDNYQFWRAQSPVWVYSLAGFFKLFGVGYAQLRVFAALFSSAGLFAAVMIAKRELRPPAVAFVALAFSLDFVLLVYGRVGMLEPAMNTLLLFAMWFIVKSRDDVRWLFPAQWALVAAFLTKQTGLYVMPVAGVFIAWAWVRARAVERRGLVRGALLAHAVVVLVLLALYVRTDAYWRSVAWNFGVVTTAKDGATAVDLSAAAAATGPRRADPEKLRVAMNLFPVLLPLALVESLRVAVNALRGRAVGWWRAMMLGWFACGVFTLFVVKEIASRYFMILAMPCLFLAGGLLDAIVGAKALAFHARVRLGLAAAAFAGFVGYNGHAYASWAKVRTYSTRDTAAAVRKAVGPRDAVVIGLWSAPLVLETKYRHFYVKNDFNASRASLEALGVTHLLLLDGADYTKTILKRHYPRLLDGLPKGKKLKILGRVITLYELAAPLGSPLNEPAPKKKAKRKAAAPVDPLDELDQLDALDALDAANE